MRSRVGHNTVLSLLGLAIPLTLAAFVMPVAVRYLGPMRFGLLGLAWAVTEYASLFDLGFGRSLVKFVAEAVEARSGALNATISLSLCIQLAAGIAGGGLLVFAAPVLVDEVFRVPPTLAGEAVGTFRVVGFGLPIVLLNGGQRAVLEGAQRFDLSAALRMVSGILSLSIPAIGAALGFGLPLILAVVLAGRVVLACLYAIAVRHTLPLLRWEWPRDWKVILRLISFGGWVFVSNLISPVLVYFDRFALGAAVGIASVGFYVAPYEAVTRVLLIPTALVGTLLPALTAIETGHDLQKFRELVAASERVLAPAMILLMATVSVFASELLTIWLGPEYAGQSANALRLLALGVFVNALAYPLLVSLYAMGRADIPAKFHIGELAFHIPLALTLISAYGINGAAAAWTLRVLIDLGLLLAASVRLSGSSFGAVLGGRTRRLFAAAFLLTAGLLACKFIASLSVAGGAILSAAAIGSFALLSWRWLLDDKERTALNATARSYLG
ncbi:MAG TPA: flippase [Gemmatimonadaceae bacterium]|nr:flippase [Gemmatimonadaceae bacterium]